MHKMEAARVHTTLAFSRKFFREVGNHSATYASRKKDPPEISCCTQRCLDLGEDGDGVRGSTGFAWNRLKFEDVQ
jgi:hypothetical protein